MIDMVWLTLLIFFVRGPTHIDPLHEELSVFVITIELGVPGHEFIINLKLAVLLLTLHNHLIDIHSVLNVALFTNSLDLGIYGTKWGRCYMAFNFCLLMFFKSKNTLVLLLIGLVFDLGGFNLFLFLIFLFVFFLFMRNDFPITFL